MRRVGLALALVVVAIVACGVGARAASRVLSPSTVDADTDGEFVLTFDSTANLTDVTMTLPAGFRVSGCPSSDQFTCHGTTTDPSQDTTMSWTRNAGTQGQPQSGHFAVDAHMPKTAGDYSFSIVTNDSAAGATEYDETVTVKPGPPPSSTTSTTRATTTTSTSSTTTTSTSSTTTSTTSTTLVSPTTAPAGNRHDNNSGGSDTNTALPLAVGVVALGTAGIGIALTARRMRRIAAGGKLGG